jgi:hypothetical protein
MSLSILCWKTESNGQASGCGTACNAYALTDKTEHQRLLGLAAGLSRVWPLDSIFKMGEPPHCQQVAQSLVQAFDTRELYCLPHTGFLPTCRSFRFISRVRSLTQC